MDPRKSFTLSPGSPGSPPDRIPSPGSKSSPRDRWRGAVKTVVRENRVASAFQTVSGLWEPEDQPVLRRVESNVPLVERSLFYDAEYMLLRAIQRAVPVLTPLALAVHYAVMEELITPTLALLVWLISLRSAVSVIVFVCLANVVNAIVKWFVLRPRARVTHRDSPWLT